MLGCNYCHTGKGEQMVQAEYLLARRFGLEIAKLAASLRLDAVTVSHMLRRPICYLQYSTRGKGSQIGVVSR